MSTIDEPDSVQSRSRSSVSPITDFYLRRFLPEPVYAYGSASAASALRLPPDRRLPSPILCGGDLAVPDTMAQRKPQCPPMSQDNEEEQDRESRRLNVVVNSLPEDLN
ncbi:hypothetical protein DPMN_085757 [Dreissena polymorpha]|uniref:Uncharacterized protein n=1 Tax=Dreissena polymorpha TaxID=45954 RepID=A0A9D3YD96_DREPO|nr:hypothetical protein DPMN_085757 [Dreissena polymorpha]